MLSYSLWTSPSPWHWIFWMQRWRTAVKRRWAWNAPGLRCSRFQALCALVIELTLLRDILSMSAWLFSLISSDWKKKNCLLFFRSGDKWLMDDRVKCRSKLSSSPSMRQVSEAISPEWNIEEHFCRSSTLLTESKAVISQLNYVLVSLALYCHYETLLFYNTKMRLEF